MLNPPNTARVVFMLAMTLCVKPPADAAAPPVETIQNAVADPIGDQQGTDLDLQVINAFINGTNLVVELFTNKIADESINGAIFIDTDQDVFTGNISAFSLSCPGNFADVGAEFIINVGSCTTDCTIRNALGEDTGADAKAEFDGNRIVVTASLSDLGNDDGIADIEVVVGDGLTPETSVSDCGPGIGSVESNGSITADYQFDGNLFSQTLNAPNATQTRSGSAFATENVLGTNRPVRTFSAGSGLRIDPTSGLISDSVYTIQMTVRIEDLTGGGSGSVKLIDFSDLQSDRGLYVTSQNGNDLLYVDGNLFPRGSTGAFPVDQWTQVVLTRDINRNIKAYIDGVEQLSFQASENNTDVSGPLVFLDDDIFFEGIEVSAGAIACLRIYPTALDGAEVAELDCELPRRVGLNGNACAFSSISEAVAAASSGDNIFIEGGYYNERIGLISDKDLTLTGAVADSDCAQELSIFSIASRPVVDGAGVATFNGTGGILDVRNSAVELRKVDLTNGTTGQGGLVTVQPGSSFAAAGVRLSHGTASSDLVNGSIFGLDEPAGGCIFAQGANVSFSFTTFANCRVLGPNDSQEMVDGDGGAIHARAGSTVRTGDIVQFSDIRLINNSARNGGAIALFNSSAELSNIQFFDNSAESDGGAIRAVDSDVKFGFNLDFRDNFAAGFGGAVSLLGETLEFTDAASFRGNRAGNGGGAIDVFLGDLQIRPSNSEFLTTQFLSNTAGNQGGAILLESVSTSLPNPTIQGVEFDNNSATNNGGALAFLSSTDIEVLDSTFSNNSAATGGAVYSQNSTSTVRSSDTCKAFEFDDPDEYCSQFFGNTATSGSAIYYRDESVDNVVATTAFVGNSGPNAVQLFETQSAGPSHSFMESVWFFENLGDAVAANGNTSYTVVHGTFDGNSGSAYVGSDSSSLFMFNSIAWGNVGGGVNPSGTGNLASICNIDQSGSVGLIVDPLFVNDGDGASHLDLLSPAVDACSEFAVLDFDLEGRARLQRSAFDMGAFEFSDVLFEDGFE